MALRNTISDREYDKFELNDDGKTAVRITGALTGELKPSGLNVGGRVSEVTVTSAGWTPLPAVPLAQRNAIAIQNLSQVEIKVNFDNSVLGYVGMVISDGSERTYDISDQIIIYARAQSGSATLNIEEIA